jgi:glycosyltransferase involved in cell wall biosynthesis
VLRVASARLLGYRVVWTVHQIRPHESISRALDRTAASALARMSNALIVLDRATGDAMARDVPSSAGRLYVVSHGSYAGVYPRGRSRQEMRAALGLAGDSFVVLSFGQIRKYKDVDLVLAGFRRAAIPGAVLLVAGLPLDEGGSRRIVQASERTSDVVTLMGFVPDEGVAELFEASDVALSARGDGGTSGSLVLALTLGVPVVAAATEANEELTARGCAGWHFAPGNADSLGDALRAASVDAERRAEKSRCAADLVAAMSWEGIAEQTARVLRGL